MKPTIADFLFCSPYRELFFGDLFAEIQAALTEGNPEKFRKECWAMLRREKMLFDCEEMYALYEFAGTVESHEDTPHEMRQAASEIRCNCAEFLTHL